MSTRLASRVLPAAVLATSTLIGGCAAFEAIGFAPNRPNPEAVKTVAGTTDGPERVTVRHVLLSFEATKSRGVTRTQDEARALAEKVLSRAKGGQDFDELVRLYSDDRHGDGSYTLVNWGVAALPSEVQRQDMVRAFGDGAFSLAPGGVTLVEYDKDRAPYGYHVIRRDK